MTNEEYNSKEGRVCPGCEDAGQIDGVLEFHGTTVTHHCSCACGEVWTAIFKLNGYDAGRLSEKEIIVYSDVRSDHDNWNVDVMSVILNSKDLRKMRYIIKQNNPLDIYKVSWFESSISIGDFTSSDVDSAEHLETGKVRFTADFSSGIKEINSELGEIQVRIKNESVTFSTYHKDSGVKFSSHSFKIGDLEKALAEDKDFLVMGYF